MLRHFHSITSFNQMKVNFSEHWQHQTVVDISVGTLLCTSQLLIYLSDVRSCILLCVDLCAEGSSPPATLYHGVHRWRHLLIAWVWTRTAGLLLVLNLLGLLLEWGGREGVSQLSANELYSCCSSSNLNQGLFIQHFLCACSSQHIQTDIQ